MIIEGFYQTTIDQYRITTRPSKHNGKHLPEEVTQPATTPVPCYRLLCSHHRLSSDQLREQREYDTENQLQFISTVNINGLEQIIAVSHLKVTQNKEFGELSVNVVSQWQHQGLAEILCRKLLEFSQQRGMRFYYSDSYKQMQLHTAISGLKRLTKKEGRLQEGYHLPGQPDILTNQQDIRVISSNNTGVTKPLLKA